MRGRGRGVATAGGRIVSQTITQRKWLHEVCAIGKPLQPRLVDGMKWHSAATHGDVSNFRQRQIERGLVPKGRKE